ILDSTLLRINNVALPGYYLLQLGSTVVGGLIVVVAYWLWFRKHRVTFYPSRISDYWHYLFWAVLFIIPIFFSIPRGLRMARIFDGYFAIRVFFFHFFLVYLSTFAPILLVASLICYPWSKKN
ncbi:MAG: DUF4184 family protein, partial [Chthoniobacterales bacterium]